MSSTSRVVGIDVARAVALLGMVLAHTIDRTPGGGEEVSAWFQLVSGRASALFAVLAGVSIVLSTQASPALSTSATGRSSPTTAVEPRAPGHPAPVAVRPGARRSVAVRAVLIAGVGLVLGIPEVSAVVILVYYGALFLCALPVLTWSARSLALLALCWALASPVVSFLLRRLLPPPRLLEPEPSSLLEPVAVLLELSVTGVYPVLTWATYLFAGMALGRLDLSSTVIARRIMVSGLLMAAGAMGVSAGLLRLSVVRASLIDSEGHSVAAASWAEVSRQISLGFLGTSPADTWWWLGIWAAHSGSIVDLVHTTGSSLAVLGALLLLTGRLGQRTRRAVHIAFGAGTMTLTLYALHILLLGAPEAVMWARTTVVQVAVLGLLGVAFLATRTRGPLERAVSEIVSRAGGSSDGRGAAR